MSKQEHEIELEDMLEYTTRILYMKIDYKGSMGIPTKMKLDCCETKVNFHPNLFIGTEQQYEEIWDKYLRGREDEFKVIGRHTFDTYEEYKKAYPKL